MSTKARFNNGAVEAALGLSATLDDNMNYGFTDFRRQHGMFSEENGNPAVALSGVNGEHNLYHVIDQNWWIRNIGAQTLILRGLSPITGLSLSGDVTVDEGFSIGPGLDPVGQSPITNQINRGHFNVGDDSADSSFSEGIYCRAVVQAQTVSDIQELVVGWRQSSGLANTTFANASYFGVLQVNPADGAIRSRVRFGTGAITDTTSVQATAMADGVAIELEVRVAPGGAPVWFVNGTQITDLPSTQKVVDTGDTIGFLPYVWYTQNGTGTSVTLQEMEYGTLRSRGIENILDPS